MKYEDFTRSYEGKLSTRMDTWLKSLLHSRNDYKPALNYIRGVAKRYGWTYAKKGLDFEDARQECFLKLLELQKDGKLKEYIEFEKVQRSKTGQTKKIYSGLGTVLKNHLNDYIRHAELDPSWEALLLPNEVIKEANREGVLINEPATIDIKTYREPRLSEEEKPGYSKEAEEIVKRATTRRKKKPEGKPYIKQIFMDSERLLTSISKTNDIVIMHQPSGKTAVGKKPYDNDVLDKIDLVRNSREVFKRLNKLRESAFIKRLFFEELITGYRAYIPLDITKKDLRPQKKTRRHNIFMLAIFLDTHINRIKRHGQKLDECKRKQEYIYDKQFLEDFHINKDSPEYREFEAYWQDLIFAGKRSTFLWNKIIR